MKTSELITAYFKEESAFVLQMAVSGLIVVFLICHAIGVVIDNHFQKNIQQEAQQEKKIQKSVFDLPHSNLTNELNQQVALTPVLQSVKCNHWETNQSPYVIFLECTLKFQDNSTDEITVPTLDDTFESGLSFSLSRKNPKSTPILHLSVDHPKAIARNNALQRMVDAVKTINTQANIIQSETDAQNAKSWNPGDIDGNLSKGDDDAK